MEFKMADKPDQRLLHRFARTVRVAAATALAEYELTGRRESGNVVQFMALAAKGAAAFRFPQDGVQSSDGLLVATVARNREEAVERLILQAQGAAGLSAYAGRSFTLRFGPFVETEPVAFDPAGRADVDVSGLVLDEDDLAAFSLTERPS